MSKKQPIQQQPKKHYNKQGGGERRPKEGGPKRFYNNNNNSNLEGGNRQNFSNQNPNYVRKDKDADKNELTKKLGNFTNIIAVN